MASRLLRITALVALTVLWGCNPLRVSKTLPDLAAHLKENGIAGSFSLNNPESTMELAGKTIRIEPEEGQLAEGTYTDAVGGTIQSTFCVIKLFDNESHAKAFATRNPKALRINGCFVINFNNDQGMNKTLDQAFRQFNPYK